MSSKSVYTSLLSVNLNELVKPYQLCQLILRLPEWKRMTAVSADDTNDTNHLLICQKLASFMYKEQLNGQCLSNNFNKTDFENMMNIIMDRDQENEYKNYNYQWIWSVIVQLQSNNNRNLQKIDKLEWIDSLWSKFQLICIENPGEIIQKRQKTESLCCSSISKCKSLKNILMTMHFYDTMKTEINDDPDLLMSYFDALTSNIYEDYQHLLLNHLNSSKKKENLDTICQIINDHVNCDINDCKSYKNQNSESVKKCINAIKTDNINQENINSFCVELLDIIHLCFMHKIILIDSNK